MLYTWRLHEIQVEKHKVQIEIRNIYTVKIDKKMSFSVPLRYFSFGRIDAESG